MKNAEDILDFTKRLIDDNNIEIEFETGEKNIPIVNSLTEFLAWIDLIKRNKNQRNTTSKTYLLNLRRTCKIFTLLFKKKIAQYKNM